MRLPPLLPLAGCASAAAAYGNVAANEGNAAKRESCSCGNERLVVQQERADAVKEAFEHAWNGYYTYAFPNDELHPVSNTSGNSR